MIAFAKPMKHEPGEQPLSIVLDAANWLPRREWERANIATRKEYLTRVCEIAVFYKNNMSLRGIDVDGEEFTPIKPQFRKDHATGAPIDPHYKKSRVIRLLRASAHVRSGRVTLWWSHGWGRIMGIHAYSNGIRLPVRNAIGFDRASLLKVKNRARLFWDAMRRAGNELARLTDKIEHGELQAAPEPVEPEGAPESVLTNPKPGKRFVDLVTAPIHHVELGVTSRVGLPGVGGPITMRRGWARVTGGINFEGR